MPVISPPVIPISAEDIENKLSHTDDNAPEQLSIFEKIYQWLMEKMLYVSGILILLLIIPITIDIVVRTFFGFSINGVMEMETLTLVLIVYAAVGYITSRREHIAVDLFYAQFSKKTQKRLSLFTYFLCLIATAIFTYITAKTAYEWGDVTPILQLKEKYFFFASSFGFLCIFIGLLFDAWRSLKERLKVKDFFGIFLAFVAIAFLCSLHLIYKGLGLQISGLIIGGIGFGILFILILLRVPIGLAMCFVAIFGLLLLKRNPTAALSALGEIPYRHTADFIYVAIPMFMLMGELTFWSGMSKGLFDCANKWLGRLPGGLACATVAGCAGFGAVCGDSLPTVITMSSVALPAMREQKYHTGLATGCLAAGGTLGILIPPSMGFIFYSLMTDESIGKLFLAGILPGLLLAGIFIGVIVFQVSRHPEWAPPSPQFPFKEKLSALLGIIPIIGLFILVVGGILTGKFTPGEGGAVGALGAYIYAVARRTVGRKELVSAMLATAKMTGKIFVIFVGVYSFGVFLASSRLPSQLAETIVEAGLNKYVFFLTIILVYVFLGCVMNIIPMMLLTLPSIYPTVQALGFDGIWFGVVTVILMEMGMITPPIGMNVFAMTSLAPDIPMATIFKGVLPFFLGMLLCVGILTLFPAIATWLPSVFF